MVLFTYITYCEQYIENVRELSHFGLLRCFCLYRKKMNLHYKKKYQSDSIVEFILTRKQDELETLSVESIARSLGINRTRLWRCFKKEKKLTLEEYIFRIRINEAAFLLQNKTELTIKEVAEKTGYYCYDYFIRIFKKYFGISPGRYKNLKNGEEQIVNHNAPTPAYPDVERN